MRPRVYVASRLRAPSAAEAKRNADLVRLACAHATAQGVRPFAPHLLYPHWLDPRDAAQDALGIEMALADLAECQQLWLYVDGRGISQGMAAELKAWQDACGAEPRVWKLSLSLEAWLGAWPLAFEARAGAPQMVLAGPGNTRLNTAIAGAFTPGTLNDLKGDRHDAA